MAAETEVEPSATVVVEPSKVIAATVACSVKAEKVDEAAVAEKIQIGDNDGGENMAVIHQNDNNSTYD